MSFPENFLKQLEQYGELSEGEKQVFLEIFAGGKTRIEIAEELHISESNLIEDTLLLPMSEII